MIRKNQQDAYVVAKKRTEGEGVIVLEVSPCFEYWLLLHFTFTTKLFQDCNEVTKALTKYIPGYNKSESFLKKANLYGKYKHLIESEAIPNAKKLEKQRDDQDELFPRAEIFKLFEWYFHRTIED